ncbi:MAG TPA: substrate-binding domain-containing protein [Gemmataceae bacterium]|nr:substrate-binding domain-containing protein [Gemmataceae bacterium]
MLRSGRLAVAAAVCLALAGCAGARKDYKYRVAVIPKGLTHDFWQSIHRGALRAADDLRAEKGIAVEIVWDGPTKEDDAQEQIAILNRRIADRVHGIVLAPQHRVAMVPPVKQAVAKNIPVVIIDSGLADEEAIVQYVATDNENGGRLAAKRLLEVLAREGKKEPRVVLLRYQVGSESTEKREKGFEEYANAHAKITWLSNDRYAGATQDSALREATGLLNNLRDEEIDGIFTPNESSTGGMLAALRSLKRQGKVRLVGFDSSPNLLDALDEGNLDGLVLQDPYRMGYLGVWSLVHHLEGYDVAAAGKYLPTGERVVTKENLHSEEVQALFREDLQAQRDMKKGRPEYRKK